MALLYATTCWPILRSDVGLLAHQLLMQWETFTSMLVLYTFLSLQLVWGRQTNGQTGKSHRTTTWQMSRDRCQSLKDITVKTMTTEEQLWCTSYRRYAAVDARCLQAAVGRLTICVHSQHQQQQQQLISTASHAVPRAIWPTSLLQTAAQCLKNEPSCCVEIFWWQLRERSALVD